MKKLLKKIFFTNIEFMETFPCGTGVFIKTSRYHLRIWVYGLLAILLLLVLILIIS